MADGHGSDTIAGSGCTDCTDKHARADTTAGRAAAIHRLYIYAGRKGAAAILRLAIEQPEPAMLSYCASNCAC